MTVDLKSIAIPRLGSGLNDGATEVAEGRARRGACMNRRTPLFSSVMKSSSMSAGSGLM